MTPTTDALAYRRATLSARRDRLRACRDGLRVYPLGAWVSVGGSPWTTEAWLLCVTLAYEATEREMETL